MCIAAITKCISLNDCLHLLPTGVVVVLNGAIIPNHGFVLLDNIGESSNSLRCLTNNTACCGRAQSPYMDILGDWYYPNDTVVANTGNGWEFYRNRGQSVVRLNRRRDGVDGIYRCVIPDAEGVNQIMFIGVYTANTGNNKTNLVNCPLTLVYHCELFKQTRHSVLKYLQQVLAGITRCLVIFRINHKSHIAMIL